MSSHDTITLGRRPTGWAILGWATYFLVLLGVDVWLLIDVLVFRELFFQSGATIAVFVAAFIVCNVAAIAVYHWGAAPALEADIGEWTLRVRGHSYDFDDLEAITLARRRVEHGRFPAVVGWLATAELGAGAPTSASSAVPGAHAAGEYGDVFETGVLEEAGGLAGTE